MKVKELIEVLSGCDPELTVYYDGYDEIREAVAAYETDERSAPYQGKELLVIIT